MNEEVHASKVTRDPETILADFLHGFTGDDRTLNDYRLDAKAAIRWLEDEGWVVKSAPISPSELQAFHDEIVRTFQSLSPSAAFDLRGKAEEKWPGSDWWIDYPEGCAAAFMARVAKALRKLPNHSENPQGPGWTYVWQPWDDLPDGTGRCPS